MELFLLYAWTRLNTLNEMIFFIFMCLLALSLMLLIYGGCQKDVYAYNKESSGFKQGVAAHQLLKKLLLPLSICITLYILVPSQKDVAIIAGGWIVKEAVQSEVAQQIGDKTYKLIMGKIDQELEKLEPKKK